MTETQVTEALDALSRIERWDANYTISTSVMARRGIDLMDVVNRRLSDILSGFLKSGLVERWETIRRQRDDTRMADRQEVVFSADVLLISRRDCQILHEFVRAAAQEGARD